MPNNPPPPISAPTDPIIGIDLGTTNSLVAWCDASGPRIIPDDQGRNLLPSVVRYDPDTGSVLAIGHEARDHAVEFPEQTIFSIKRLMGRGIADAQPELAYLPYAVVPGDNNTARVQIGPHILSPQQISADILSELRRRAEAYFRTPVRKAVVTVPAYFDDAQRQATRDAGAIAGLQILRILNEPTASSLAYNLGLHPPKTGKPSGVGNLRIGTGHCSSESESPAQPASTTQPSPAIAVFDLGGGTFDVSILRLHQTPTGLVDQVLATAGDTHLGGDDIDRMLVELFQRDIQAQFGPDLSFPPATRQALRSLAEATKINLSSEPSTQLQIDLGPGKTYRRTLTRAELENIIAPWIDRAIDCCRNALHAARLTTSDVSRVVMVGGSTRIPLVLSRVAAFFSTTPYTALNPEEVVALGAAVQASILAGVNRDMLLLDVIPLSLGIETMGGAVAKLIVANSPIPAKATEMFSTYADGQTNVKIHVLQGERELVKDCRSLGQFDLRGIPPMPAGLPKIEVTFLVDANGILNVTAVEKRSEKSASIQIIPNHGLTRQEVAQMEAASLQHAKEDMTAHRLIDLRNQARLDIRAIQRQLAKTADLLDPAYKQQIQQHVAAVNQFIHADNPDPDQFHQALDAMDKASVRLAEIAIKKTLQDDNPS